jgi:hypothetical protein
LIRHARRGQVLPPPVLTLPVAMIQQSFRTLLMPTIGTSPLAEPGLLAAGLAAIALPAVTMRAQKEHRAAFAEQANAQPEDRLAMSRHASWQAALDNGNPFVAT